MLGTTVFIGASDSCAKVKIRTVCKNRNECGTRLRACGANFKRSASISGHGPILGPLADRRNLLRTRDAERLRRAYLAQ
jgi:hypothetical protein